MRSSQVFLANEGQKNTKYAILRSKFGQKCTFGRLNKSQADCRWVTLDWKPSLDYQMSHIVVQENHIDNSKINYNIAENIVYFFSLVVKDPVERSCYRLCAQKQTCVQRHLLSIIYNYSLPPTCPALKPVMGANFQARF